MPSRCPVIFFLFRFHETSTWNLNMHRGIPVIFIMQTEQVHKCCLPFVALWTLAKWHWAKYTQKCVSSSPWTSTFYWACSEMCPPLEGFPICMCVCSQNKMPMLPLFTEGLALAVTPRLSLAGTVINIWPLICPALPLLVLALHSPRGEPRFGCKGRKFSLQSFDSLFPILLYNFWEGRWHQYRKKEVERQQRPSSYREFLLQNPITLSMTVGPSQ